MDAVVYLGIDHYLHVGNRRGQQGRHSRDVRFASGGLLESITGHRSASVNSLHSQGIDRLGEGLVMEATADDGRLEAFTVGDAWGYTLGVQWHPEWKVEENPASKAIFRSFGESCKARSMQR